MKDERRSAVLAAYGVLASRYESNTTLQWQVPAFAIAAEGALLAGAIATTGWIACTIGSIALFVNLAAVVAMRRIELTAWWDRELLDQYELVLLKEDENLRLRHGELFADRLDARPLQVARRSAVRRLDLAIARRLKPAVMLIIAQSSVALLAFVVGLERI